MALAVAASGRLMNPMAERNRRLRARRSSRDAAGRHPSIADLSREFGISRAAIYQILDRTGGDPAAYSDDYLDGATIAELERERDRLRDRIAADRRRLRLVTAYLDSKRISLINRTDEFGLAG